MKIKYQVEYYLNHQYSKENKKYNCQRNFTKTQIYKKEIFETRQVSKFELNSKYE